MRKKAIWKQVFFFFFYFDLIQKGSKGDGKRMSCSLLLPPEKHASAQGCTHAAAKMKSSVMFGEQYIHQIPVNCSAFSSLKEATYHLPGVSTALCYRPCELGHSAKFTVTSPATLKCNISWGRLTL